jgi:anaerobic dimethyl sulfoxide reductase subunit B (iron-sulfur subunit)
MTYAFTLDASACSGCKACQEACKDKNGLPLGILWRRVIEVSGGEWQAKGRAWENNIFAYNLSLACNHCTHPKCAGVCPTDAYSVRLDGVVLLDQHKCMGCGYCAWACPYGAPQYDQERGVMTKCDFCIDYLDSGLPPACVSACPLRVLGFGDMQNLENSQAGLNLWQLAGSEHPYPLPHFSRTEPHLALKPHPAMKATSARSVSNREEIWPPGSIEAGHGLVARHELPLVAFTLLGQMAAGMAIAGLVTSTFPTRAMWSIGLLQVVGGLSSFLHLGRKSNAWRAVIHLRKSWLSREVLMALLFAAAWVATAIAQVLDKPALNSWLMAILGVGLVFSMSRVYCLRAVPDWNRWQTTAAFFLSTVSLGVLGMRIFISFEGWAPVAGLALLVELGMAFTIRKPAKSGAWRLRILCLGLSACGVLLLGLLLQAPASWMVGLLLGITLVEEALGRWQFYAWRVPFPGPIQ